MTLADFVSWLVRTHFLVHRFGIVVCPHVVDKAGELWGLFYENTDPIHAGSTKASLLPTVIFGGEDSSI